MQDINYMYNEHKSAFYLTCCSHQSMWKQQWRLQWPMLAKYCTWRVHMCLSWWSWLSIGCKPERLHRCVVCVCVLLMWREGWLCDHMIKAFDFQLILNITESISSSNHRKKAPLPQALSQIASKFETWCRLGSLGLIKPLAMPNWGIDGTSIAHIYHSLLEWLS